MSDQGKKGQKISIWIVFDLDGVIVDTAPTKIALYRKFLGATYDDAALLKICRPSDVLTDEEAVEYCNLYEDNLPSIDRFISDEYLLSLKHHGFKVGLVTRQPKNRVQLIFPNSMFDRIVTEEDLNGQTKDEANAIDFEGKVIFVGDTSEDIRAARIANAFSVFVSWGYEGSTKENPDAVVSDTFQLTDCLGEMSGVSL